MTAHSTTYDYYLVGIGGTLMSCTAGLLKQAGYSVSGCDKQLYSPTDLMLKAMDIPWDTNIQHVPAAHNYILGNVNSRGQPLVESLLKAKATIRSAPEVIRSIISRDRCVIAIAGTHGKTTTTSLLAHILQGAGLDPGWLIAGNSRTPSQPYNLGTGPFVIEADEYDTAFFDKRPKFVHYWPDIALINNIEFDHADIYTDIEAILQQFHYFTRQISPDGILVAPEANPNIESVLKRGLWSALHYFDLNKSDQSGVFYNSSRPNIITIAGKNYQYALPGKEQAANVAAALTICRSLGITDEQFGTHLESYKPVARRRDIVYQWRESAEHGIYQGMYIDDFAHHPTSIAATIQSVLDQKNDERKGLTESLSKPAGRILVAIECASNSMKSGIFRSQLVEAVQQADIVWWWGDDKAALSDDTQSTCHNSIEELANEIIATVTPQDTILTCSNGDFGNLRNLLHQGLSLKL